MQLVKGSAAGNCGRTSLRGSGPTLLLGEESAEPLEKVGNVFHQFADAWAFVDAQIE
jgi:hypothetical protein